MKKSINLKTLALLGILFTGEIFAQVTPKFYTDNGTKVVTEMDCATLTDLSVKMPIEANLFKYDDVDIIIEVDMNQKMPGTTYQDIYVYKAVYTQKKFDIKYGGKNEMHVWLVNPKDGFGELVGDDGNTRTGLFCGSTPKEKCDVRFSVYAYVQTGEKEYYNESTKIWEKIPTYDEGTLIGEANLVVKQTAENMATAKKNKLKKRFGM